MGTSRGQVSPNSAGSAVSLSTNHQQVLQETVKSFLIKVTKMILPHDKQLSISGTIGVTVDSSQVVLVHITETVNKSGHQAEQEKPSTSTESPSNHETVMPTITDVFSVQTDNDDAAQVDVMRQSPVDREIIVPNPQEQHREFFHERNVDQPLVLDHAPVVIAPEEDPSPNQDKRNRRPRNYGASATSWSDSHASYGGSEPQKERSPLTNRNTDGQGLPIKQEPIDYSSHISPKDSGSRKVLGTVWNPAPERPAGFSFGRTLAHLAATATAALNPAQGYPSSLQEQSTPGNPLRSLLMADNSVSPSPYHLRQHRQPRHIQKCGCADDHASPTTYHSMDNAGEHHDPAPSDRSPYPSGSHSSGEFTSLHGQPMASSSPSGSILESALREGTNASSSDRATDSPKVNGSLLGRLLKTGSHSSPTAGTKRRMPDSYNPELHPASKVGRESLDTAESSSRGSGGPPGTDERLDIHGDRSPGQDTPRSSSALRQLLCGQAAPQNTVVFPGMENTASPHFDSAYSLRGEPSNSSQTDSSASNTETPSNHLRQLLQTSAEMKGMPQEYESEGQVEDDCLQNETSTDQGQEDRCHVADDQSFDTSI